MILLLLLLLLLSSLGLCPAAGVGNPADALGVAIPDRPLASRSPTAPSASTVHHHHNFNGHYSRSDGLNPLGDVSGCALRA
jgi:hypothetical protein